jgi:hypothetical protein
MVAVIASGCARYATSPSPNDGVSAAPSLSSIAPSPANPEQPIPVPDGTRILAVLDPEVVRPQVNADQAVELAGATFGRGVGESPSVQLATVAFRDGGSEFTPVWTGWIILSTDLPGWSSCGPFACVPKRITVPNTWVWVTVDGEVLSMVEGPVASSEPTLPMPDADLIAVVHDPALYPGLSADEAIVIGRENPSGLVGASPRVQLVSTITTPPESPLDGFTGWVILSTDVPGFQSGPINRPSVTEYATYSWVFVTLDGDIVVATQNTYLTPESVPALPGP